MRLVLLGGRIIALSGRGCMPGGEPGGELAMAQYVNVVATKCDASGWNVRLPIRGM
jgi:hypothetical protein